MQIEIRLKKILGQAKLDKFGIIQRIAKDIGVHRHTIRKIYRNQLVNPSLETLGLLCDWLRAHGVREDLPQALLGYRPSDLWKAITVQGEVRIYLGEYQQIKRGAPVMRWISRWDATVHSKLVQHLSTPSDPDESHPLVLTRYVPFRLVSLGSHTGREILQRDLIRSEKVFREMQSSEDQHTSILIGSQIVNHLVEHLVADLFGCKPFCLQKRRIKVPFYLTYRDSDHAVPSCFGGLKNPPGRRAKVAPGIYYLDSSGKWTHCPWVSGKQDAGIIITVYDPGTQGMVLAVLGFSGRGTEVVGRRLLEDADVFWPPYVQFKGKRIGIYVCRFEMAPVTSADNEGFVHARNPTVVAIEKDILSKYLA